MRSSQIKSHQENSGEQNNNDLEYTNSTENQNLKYGKGQRESDHNESFFNKKGQQVTTQSQVIPSRNGMSRTFVRHRSHGQEEEKRTIQQTKSAEDSIGSDSEKSIQSFDRKSNAGRSARAAARRNALEQKAKDELIKYSANSSNSNNLLTGPQGRRRVKRSVSPVKLSSHRGDRTTFLKMAPTQLQPKRKPFKAPTGVFVTNEAVSISSIRIRNANKTCIYRQLTLF